MSLASWLSDQLVALLGLLGLGGGGGLVGYIRRVDTRSQSAKDLAEYNNARLEGTDDPNDEGVLDIAHQTREKVNELERQMTDQHRELMSRLDEVADNGDFETTSD